MKFTNNISEIICALTADWNQKPSLRNGTISSSDSVSDTLSVSEGMTAQRSLDSTDGCRELLPTTWGEGYLALQRSCTLDCMNMIYSSKVDLSVCSLLTKKCCIDKCYTKITGSHNYLIQNLVQTLGRSRP